MFNTLNQIIGKPENFTKSFLYLALGTPNRMVRYADEYNPLMLVTSGTMLASRPGKGWGECEFKIPECKSAKRECDQCAPMEVALSGSSLEEGIRGFTSRVDDYTVSVGFAAWTRSGLEQGIARLEQTRLKSIAHVEGELRTDLSPVDRKFKESYIRVCASYPITEVPDYLPVVGNFVFPLPTEFKRTKHRAIDCALNYLESFFWNILWIADDAKQQTTKAGA